MKDEGAPERLLALAGPDSVVGRGVRAAQNRGPSETELRALEKTLAATLGAAALGTAVAVATTKSATTAASAWLTAGTVKLTTGIVVAALSVGGGAVAWKRHVAARSHTVAAVAVAAPSPRAFAGRPAAAPSVGAEATGEAVARDEAPVADLPTGSVTRSPARVNPRPSAVSAPRRAALPTTTPVPQRARTADLGVPDPTDAADPALAPTLADEVKLIDGAQRALQSDPGRALALVQEHARRFPNQLLEQEREVIAVAALVKLERKAEAAERARRFLGRFPRSAHAVRMHAVAASH